jgi:hypothetical protein
LFGHPNTGREDKLMKYIFIALLLAAPVAIGQTGTAAIAGAILDAKTQKPVPAALITAVSSLLPSLSKHSKSGGDGAFLIQGLVAGNYVLCVQAPGDQYLDPCQWNGSPVSVTLTSGNIASGILVNLTAAAVVHIQIQDTQRELNRTTADGRRPGLTLGVWGPKGLFYPARAVSVPATGAKLAGASTTYTYRLAVPHDTPLNLAVASRDLKLGDDKGAALPANASRQAFQHASGDPSPKSFTFAVQGRLP